MFNISYKENMLELSEKKLKDTIDEQDVLILDFYATWCGPCKLQSDIFEKIEKSRAINYEIIKVNVDEYPQIANLYNIEAIPSVLVLKRGNVIHKFVGVTSEEELISKIENID